MRLDQSRESENVEDRRSSGGRAAVAMGGGSLLILLIAMLFGADPRQLMRIFEANGPAQRAPADPNAPPANDEQTVFIRKILGETEDVWGQVFQRSGLTYEKPTLVLYSGQVQSACGFASAAMGPFYCPADRKLYLDTEFFQELSAKHGAGGDFAQAYVIAHEIGHHVQNLLGTSQEVQSKQGRISKEDYNDLSVRLELQADFFAGVWAHHAHKKRRILEEGDIEEGLNAANAIGDDRLQMEAQGYVIPDSFTHGSSQQRVKWFKKGLMTGDLSQGDTFRTNDL